MLRQALAANASLAAEHSMLAALLRATSPVLALVAAGGAGGGGRGGGGGGTHMHSSYMSRGTDTGGMDASGGSGEGGEGMGAMSHMRAEAITDEHVSAALRLAMRELASEEAEAASAAAAADGVQAAADADSADVAERATDDSDAHMHPHILQTGSSGADGHLLARTGVGGEEDSMMLDVLPQNSFSDAQAADAQKEALLELCRRDAFALASMTALLQGLRHKHNVSALAPHALGPLQELCDAGGNEDMFRMLAHDSEFMRHILLLARSPEARKLLCSIYSLYWHISINADVLPTGGSSPPRPRGLPPPPAVALHF